MTDIDKDAANGRLLVAAVNALPALLAEIERLRTCGKCGRYSAEQWRCEGCG